MDYVFFILFILALIAGFYFIRKSDIRTKNKYKLNGYHLLEEPHPDPKKIVETIKLLRLYGGRWRKDKEFVDLVRLLADRLNEIEKA
jgi:hypothetical protein